MKRMVIRLYPNRKSILIDALKTSAILAAATIINSVIVRFSGGNTNNVSEIYILGVLLSSLATNGYFWGLVAAVAGVFITNYLFTVPYNALDFSSNGYPLTFLNMLIVAVVTGTMAAWIKEQVNLSRAREMKTQQVNVINQRLFSTQSAEQVAKLAAECFFRFLNHTVRVYLEPNMEQFAQFGEVSVPFDGEREKQALLWAFQNRAQCGCNQSLFSDCAFWYIPLRSGQHALAVVGILSKGQTQISGEPVKFLQILLSQFTLALERQRLTDERQQIVIEKQREQIHGDLLRSISHDLRTPLTGIIGASSALIENESKISAESKRQLVCDIQEDAGWLLRMVENILSITKLGQHETQIHKRPEPVEEVVEQAVKRCRKQFPSMRLKLHLPEEFFMVPMDGTLIAQVLINLIENSVRHSGSTEPIDVFVRGSDEGVEIVVRDYGKGIPEQDLPALFDGVLLYDKENTDTTRGLGLGLSICKSIISAHDGSIKAENAPDGGACFTFMLPLEEDYYERKREYTDC